MWLKEVDRCLHGGKLGKSLMYIREGSLAWGRGVGIAYDMHREDKNKVPSALFPVLIRNFVRFPPPEK